MRQKLEPETKESKPIVPVKISKAKMNSVRPAKPSTRVYSEPTLVPSLAAYPKTNHIKNTKDPGVIKTENAIIGPVIPSVLSETLTQGSHQSSRTNSGELVARHITLVSESHDATELSEVIAANDDEYGDVTHEYEGSGNLDNKEHDENLVTNLIEGLKFVEASVYFPPVLRENLPIDFQANVVDFMEFASVEVKQEATEIFITIAAVSERLKDLYADEQFGSQEIIAIEAFIAEKFEELRALGLEIDSVTHAYLLEELQVAAEKAVEAERINHQVLEGLLRNRTASDFMGFLASSILNKRELLHIPIGNTTIKLTQIAAA